MSKTSVDLTLLKRYVSELEASLSLAEKVVADKQEYAVEMSKASGLASGITIEAALLIGDINAATVGKLPPKLDSMQDILKELKNVKGSGSN
jgi:hypothetical protein